MIFVKSIFFGLISFIAANAYSQFSFNENNNKHTKKNKSYQKIEDCIINCTYINVKKYGIKGDGVTDDSPAFQALLDDYTSGVTIFLPPGTYILKDIKIHSGTKIITGQNSVNNWIAKLPCIIKPGLQAKYIFDLDVDAHNVAFEGLYINGDASRVPNLIAAIRLNGTFHNIYNNNIVNCARHAILTNAGAVHIEGNNLQGLANKKLQYIDYIGALHITSMGDSYIINNEIGGGSEYIMYSDKFYQKSVAVYADKLVNSNITGNIFEVADRAFYFKKGINCYFSGNRYEYCTAGGLYLEDVVQCVFMGERFNGNSTVEEGKYDNLHLSSLSSVTFVTPIFNLIKNASFTVKKVRYNISNERSNENNVYKNILISPFFSDNSYTKGNVNLNIGSFPLFDR